MGKTVWITATLVATLAVPAFAADDDLDVVKRATQAPARVEATPAPARRDKPTWLKVEAVDVHTGKRRVSVSLPIALVEVFGDDVPVRWGCGGEAERSSRCGLRLKETLALLQSGQALVEIEQDDKRIKVWVE